MNLYATRITEGADLKKAIVAFAKSRNLSAVAVISSVGSLSKARLRMADASADQQDVRDYKGPFEIVSLTGTIARGGQAHLHIAISDQEGQVVGGHLKDGCLVHTTVELVVAGDEGLQFTREFDSNTGFDELVIKESE